jgi:poly-gamma-glutamate synthesis protein (capsule biosynthesis protein)
MAKRFVVTATGDSLITRRMPAYTDAGFTGLVDLIQSADVAFTNMEMVLSEFEGTPVVESGGMNLSAHPGVARDLQRMGFNLTAFANNHTLNYGIEGCLRTLDELRAIDFVCAGAGRTLSEARLPVFLETPAGRVGLVGCASSFGKGQQAGARRDDTPGRPGLNPQRYDTLFVVDQEHGQNAEKDEPGNSRSVALEACPAARPAGTMRSFAREQRAGSHRDSGLFGFFAAEQIHRRPSFVK